MVLSLAKEPHGDEHLSALDSCMPHYEIPVTFFNTAVIHRAFKSY